MAAFCVAILSLGSLVESLDVSLSVIAGLVIMVLSAEYGDRVAFSAFAVAGLLSLVLPLKSPGVIFLSFFGWYPIVQKKINMLKPILCRVVKTVLFNLILIILLALSAFVTGIREATWLYASTVILANFCFVFYDILLDRFLIWYILKLRHRFHF